MGNEAREVLQAQGRAWDLILMTIKKKKKDFWRISNQRGHIKFSKNYGSCREGDELQGPGSTEN